jgi:hypothetical protein
LGSAHNFADVRRVLERLIDQLEHDEHHFGGNRVRAIEDLRRAREHLIAALRWDATYPH